MLAGEPVLGARLAFSQWPQGEHVRVVLGGSTGHDRHPGQPRLVFDEGLELEGPSRMLGPVLGPNRCPLADAREVFEGDAVAGAFGRVTILLVMRWLLSAKPRSGRFIFRSRRLAVLVPGF